ncbi:MAG: hypothetical protein CM1200mP41_33870 [Gammaproteobacteria bacterium]|nr:MAG: hypothetical protein CM1200mP41_33870 [Gammaproteobacteria bacterium]
MAIRVPSDGYPHGVAYTKPAGVSLEEMAMEDIVITDIPTADILVGSEMTSVGHNLNREILGCVLMRTRSFMSMITIPLDCFHLVGLARSVSCRLTFHLFMANPRIIFLRILMSSRMHDCLVPLLANQLSGHARTWSHHDRSNDFRGLPPPDGIYCRSKRVILAEQLAAIKGTAVQYRSLEEINQMYRLSDQVIYPDRAVDVMARINNRRHPNWGLIFCLSRTVE